SRRSGTPARERSRCEWVLRSGFAFALLVLALISTATSMANVVLKLDPGTAYLLAPVDGRAAAALALQNFSAAPDSNPHSAQATLAKRALRLDATSVDALIVLAMQAEMQRDALSADRLFAHSFALSRREL